MAKTKRVNTENLKPGDRVMGSERAELMIGPGGLYVDKIQMDKATNGGLVFVWWVGSALPEAFNCYWTWYVEDEPKLEAPPEIATSEPKARLAQMVAEYDHTAAENAWISQRWDYVEKKFSEFADTEDWQKAIAKYPRAVHNMEDEIKQIFFKEFEKQTPRPQRQQ